MKLYLECNMGASGNMLMAALYELLPDKNSYRNKMEQLCLPGVTFEYTTATKCGITGTHIAVKVGGIEEISDDHKRKQGDGSSALYDQHHDNDYDHNHHRTKQGDGSSALKDQHQDNNYDHNHHHNGHRYGYEEILELIRGLVLPEKVKKDALGIYRIIGEAEAAVHGLPINEIHLHEIGSLDAVADVVGCSLLIDMLGVTEITASPVHVGYGSVRCEHGILPVPAPAATEILKGVPIYSGCIEGELCTPTGAALLKHFATRFESMPLMAVVRTGYGMGTKDFEAANCLRAFLSEKEGADSENSDVVCEISCNLDDMTPEAIGAAFDVLFENGALDVYATPIVMKKNRPAVMLACLCEEGKRDSIAQLMLENTTTIGVRITTCSRVLLDRSVETVLTGYGQIRVKRAHGFGMIKLKPEYDDVQAAAKKHAVPFATVYDAARQAAATTQS